MFHTTRENHHMKVRLLLDKMKSVRTTKHKKEKVELLYTQDVGQHFISVPRGSVTSNDSMISFADFKP